MSLSTSRRKARLPLIAAAVGACFAAFAGNALAADVATEAQMTAALAGTDAVINVAPGFYVNTSTFVVNRSVTIRRNPAFPTGTVTFSGALVATGSPVNLNVFHITAGNTVTMEDINLEGTQGVGDAMVENFGTFNFNYSSAVGGTGLGLVNRAGATLNVLNSTIADNGATGVLGTGVGTVNLRSTTISNNSGTATSVAAAGTFNIINSIINSLAPADCQFPADSVIFSLGSDATPTCAAAYSPGALISNASANTSPVQVNAPGRTASIRISAPSAAIDAGASGANCPPDDQRRVSRPGGPACDIGAFEVNTIAVTTPGNLTVQATGALTPVAFTATASNPETGAVLTPTCTSPAAAVTGTAPNFSISLPLLLPVAPVTVTCSATSGPDTASRSFTITINDLIAPVFVTQPTNPQTATSADGLPVAVTFSPAATANDVASGPVTPVCVPASGSLFAIGSTTVTCTATDPHGNFSTISFDVQVSDGSANSTTQIDPSNQGANVNSNSQVILDRNITTTIAVSRTVDFGRITMGGTYTAHTPVNPFVRVSTNAVNGYDLYVNRTEFTNPNTPFFRSANRVAGATPNSPTQGNTRTDDIPLALTSVVAPAGTATNPLIASVTRPTPVGVTQSFLGASFIPVGTPPLLRGPEPTNLRVGLRQTYTLEDGDTWTTNYTLGPLSYAPAGPAAAIVTYTAAVHP